MILVGQYDSPYVRRVAVSLRVLGFDYEHDTRSVFGDFDSMRQTNPLARIPSRSPSIFGFKSASRSSKVGRCDSSSISSANCICD